MATPAASPHSPSTLRLQSFPTRPSRDTTPPTSCSWRGETRSARPGAGPTTAPPRPISTSSSTIPCCSSRSGPCCSRTARRASPASCGGATARTMAPEPARRALPALRRQTSIAIEKCVGRSSVTRSRRIGCVLLPFAAGYYLSYLFRTINALIAADLTADLGLSAADLGLLTAVYFLVFAAAQIPCGILLDRHGPRTLLSGLLLLASAGALLFALADTLLGLLFGRALIGAGGALALMGGFKAIVLWFPPGRLASPNAGFVMLGALGAVTATAPADLIVASVGWRGLFAVLGALSALAALIIVAIVPDEARRPTPVAFAAPALSLLTIYRQRHFWRLAPLSSLGIGTSWSLQGLWAAPWLRDVDGLDRAGVVEVLSLMAIVVSASGLLLGLAATHVRRLGGKTEYVLVAAIG